MKKRLDQLLVDRGLIETRNKAQAIIMTGNVFVDGKKVDKVGTPIDIDAEIIVEQPFPYVSRGALKLERAHQEFDLDFEGKTICDIGSSTGGFTDYSLQHGAKKVLAVDVGTGQLAQKIRENDKVVVMERTDFRDFNPAEAIDMFVCDVSFISLKQIIPKIAELIYFLRHPDHKKPARNEFDSGGDPGIDSSARPQNDKISVEAILLIKPQFEVGRIEASRGKGVITDPELHNKVIQEIQDCALENDFTIKGIVPSPITGAKGNKEFLIYLTKS